MGAGDLLVRIGAVTFIVGALGTLATVAPLLLDTRRLPTPAYFVSMLMGVGLAVALCGLLKAALAQRQGAAEAVAVRERAELS
jgi:nitrate/nitrite transporter NarK